MSLAILLLLVPSMATWVTLVMIPSLPYSMLGITLLIFKGQAMASRKHPKRGEVGGPGKAHIDLSSSVVFTLLGLVSGTLGEALTDSATTLAVRKQLKSGKSDLALTNHLTVLLSMSLAYWTQSKSETSPSKQMICITLWALCQVFRLMALPHLENYGTGLMALGAMVFLD